MPVVSVVMGSKTDESVMEGCIRILSEHRIDYEQLVLSCHRTPDKVREFARKARERGIRLIIAGAGKAAMLPGFIAGYTDLPVIGVPLDIGGLAGIDALLSIVQMPSGVPIGCMGIGPSGAKNAAYFALRILGI